MANARFTPTSKFIELGIEEGGKLWQLTINRPQAKNALSVAMYADMAGIITAFEADEAAAVLMLSGAAGQFTSGNDLADFASIGTEGLLNEQSPLWRFMAGLRDCSKPVIAVVEGVAVGIGTTLLLHVDAVFAARDAQFAMPFSRLGLCPEYASSLLLTQVAGAMRANDWLMTGRTFSAEEALAGNLLTAVGDAPYAAAKAHAQSLLQVPLASLITTKRLVKAPLAAYVHQVMLDEAEAFKAALQSDAFKQAVAAFFQRK